jgi:antitoxin component of MazEF toxin-antitoxin module
MKKRFINSAIFMIAVFLVSAFPAFAQESEAVVVDEVVAQVNDGVITLSRIKREMKNTADAMVERGKTPDEAKAEIEKKKGELIAGLIDEELVLQKGKELGADSNVDAQINQRFTQIMKERNVKTIAALYEEMRKAGINPDDIREMWRKQFMQETVLQREVDQKVYYGWSNKEIKDYYESNKAKFTKPETVSLSEIFLGFAGRNPDAVRQKADQLIAAMRGGADFTKTAIENSDSPDVQTNKGSAGSFSIKDLNEKIAAAIKNVKAGDFAKLENDEGIQIIRVDTRSVASSESVFSENAVRSALTYEKLPEERKKFMATLRKDAYIKISDTYRPIVAPILGIDAAKAAVSSK